MDFYPGTYWILSLSTGRELYFRFHSQWRRLFSLHGECSGGVFLFVCFYEVFWSLIIRPVKYIAVYC